MEEQLISFETAKLSKEKGFNIPSHSYYFEDGEFKEFEINDTYGYYGDEYTVNRTEFYNNWNDKFKTTKQGVRCFGCDNNPKYLETFSAPTQSVLKKWLREVHNVIVVSLPYTTSIENIEPCYIWMIYKKQASTATENGIFKTYEEALEIGLQQAALLIKTLK